MNATTSSALMTITPRPEAIMCRGEGSYLWDNDDRRYLDFIQGWAVNSLGHCPPQITEALNDQAHKLISPSPALHNAPQHELATLLTSLSGLTQVHFANSGAEANEAAIKLARKWGRQNKGGAYEIITTHNAFHGRTLATMAASGKPGWDDIFPPAMRGFSKVPFGDATAMRKAINDNTVALMVEPIQGEAGVIVPPPGYLQALRSLADEHGLLLILDEVQTGIGRTGLSFAYEHEQVLPDIATLGKGLGGGVPLSAMMAREHVCVFEYGDQGGTYNGNPLMTAVGLAVVKTVCNDRFLSRVRQAGEALHLGLLELGQQFGFKEVRGRGLLWAVDLASANAADIQARALQAGLIINAPRDNSLRLMPALNVQEDEMAEALTILAQALK